jgi:PAS domain S-box-containing protein
VAKLLLIGDNPGDARLIREYLAEEKAGRFDLESAGRLSTGLSLLEEERIDLVLLDLGLPDSKGFATFAAVHARAPGLPIIVLTDLEDEDLAVKTVQKGAQDYLVKGSLDGALLARAIRYAIERKRAERALRESEGRLKALFDGSNDAILITHPAAGRFVDCNKGAEELTGYSREEILSLRVGDLSPPDWRERAKEQFGVLRGGEPLRVEWPIRTKGGGTVLVEISSRAVTIGEKSYVQGILRDMTERKRAEEALKESEHRYRTVGQVISDFAYSCIHIGGGEYKVDWITDSFFAITGHTKEDLRAHRCWMFTVHPDDQALAQDQLASLTAGSMNVREFRILCRNGEMRWLRNHARCVDDEKIPGQLRVYGAAQDITEHKRAEEEIQALAKFPDENPNPVVRVREDGTILYANKASSLLLAAWRAQVGGSIPDEWHDRIQEALRAGHVQEAEFEHEERFLSLTIAPIAGADYANVYALNITERRRAEEHVRRLLDRQVTVNRLALALGETLDLGEIYQRLYVHVRALVDADGFIVSSYDPEDKLIRAEFLISDGTRHDTSRFPPIPLEEVGHGTQSRVIRTGEPLYLPDYREAMRQTRKEYTFDEDGSVVEGPPPPGAEGMSTNSALLVPLKVAGKTVGVLQLQSDRRDAYTQGATDLLCGLANVAAVAIQNAQLYGELEKALESTVQTMGLTVEMRDPYTAGHQRRVTDLACAMAKEMHVEEQPVRGIRAAGLIHDIGKLSIPAEILSKPSKLTDAEFALVKTHPQVAYDMVKTVKLPWPVAEIVLQHHERLDGSGYPRGLRGDAILVEARILAVADVVEAMASHRPHRPALGVEKALEEIAKGKGILYDPPVVDACVKVIREGRCVL